MESLKRAGKEVGQIVIVPLRSFKEMGMMEKRFGWFAGVLVIGLSVMAGIQSGAQTTKSDDSTTKAQKSEKGDSGESKPVWTADLSKVTIPTKTAVGSLHGEPFTVERAELQNGVLSLRQGREFFADLEFKLFLFTPQNMRLDGQSLEILDEENPSVKTVPHIHMSWKPDAKSLPKTKTWTGDYVIKLKFGQMKNGRLPGQIYLCLPDMKQSFVAGTFEAIVK
jgi:hypothetical protein